MGFISCKPKSSCSQPFGPHTNILIYVESKKCIWNICTSHPLLHSTWLCTTHQQPLSAYSVSISMLKAVTRRCVHACERRWAFSPSDWEQGGRFPRLLQVNALLFTGSEKRDWSRAFPLIPFRTPLLSASIHYLLLMLSIVESLFDHRSLVYSFLWTAPTISRARSTGLSEGTLSLPASGITHPIMNTRSVQSQKLYVSAQRCTS